MNIVVVGSINMDVINEVERHPLPGETIHGLGTSYSPGGKGANQAVAAAKSGATVVMIGAVGEDGFAAQLEGALAQAGVDTALLQTKPVSSGIAFITVSKEGENNIILSQGANGAMTSEDVEAASDVIQSADVMLLQNEIPWETTRRAMELAATHNVRVYFNPAPALTLPRAVLPLIDTLVINETEAQAVTGMTVTGEADGRKACQKLLEQGVRAVVLTLGGAGSLYLDNQGNDIFTPAFSVSVVDTTAAGDTFIGALVSQAGLDVKEALRYASAAAALAVTKPGAQASIPEQRLVREFFSQSGESR